MKSTSSIGLFELPQLVNVFDMNTRHVDVIALEDAIKYGIEIGQLRKKHKGRDTRQKVI